MPLAKILPHTAPLAMLESSNIKVSASTTALLATMLTKIQWLASPALLIVRLVLPKNVLAVLLTISYIKTTAMLTVQLQHLPV